MTKLKLIVVLFSMSFPIYVGSLLFSTFSEIQNQRLQTYSEILEQ